MKTRALFLAIILFPITALAAQTEPVAFEPSASPAGWTLTLRAPLVPGDTPDRSPTIRLGNTHYTVGRDFGGATAAEQAASLAAVLGRLLPDDRLEGIDVADAGGGRIALRTDAAAPADAPFFLYTTFRPGNWWLDLSYDPENPLAANAYRNVREPDRIRPFASWTRRVKDGTLARIPLGASEPWYAAYSLPGRRVYAIVEPYYTQEVLSYLVVGDARALLLDTGMGFGDLRRAVREILAAENIAIDTDDPAQFLVLISHTDADHTLGNHQFRGAPFLVFSGPNNAHPGAEGEDALPGPERLTLPQPARPVNADDPGDELMADLPAAFTAELAAAGGTLIRPGVDRSAITGITPEAIAAGCAIDLGGRTLRIVHTPGHTADGLSLIDEANRLVFTGDFYYSGPNYVYSESADMRSYADSARRLRDAVEGGIRATGGNPADWWVLGQHNEPVRDARILSELADMSRAILDGTLKKTPWKEGGNVSANSREAGSGTTEYRTDSRYSPTGSLRIAVPRALYFD